MKKVKIYLDMDSVIADFEKEMFRMSPEEFDDESFRNAVKDNEIFLKLDLMPNARKLLDAVKAISDVDVEMLTGVGIENDPEHKARVIKQKTQWLKEKGIPYKPNFVERMAKKGEYATPYTILIDDCAAAVNPFNDNGGIGILYVDKKVDEAIEKLNEAVYTIKKRIESESDNA